MTKQPTNQDLSSFIHERLGEINQDLLEYECYQAFPAIPVTEIKKAIEFETFYLYEANYSILDYKDIAKIIRNELKTLITFNVITHSIEIDGHRLSDSSETILYSRLDSFLRKGEYTKKSPSKDIFKGAIAYLAQLHETNPITSNFVKWDGVERLDQFLYCLKDEHGMAPSFLNYFLMGSIEKLHNPKGFQNPVLVLDGNQKIGKTTFVNFLGSPFGDYYVADGSLDPESKDDRLSFANSFIYNWEEAGSFTKRQKEALKALIFANKINMRRAYTKYEDTYKVFGNIIMPKNQGEFLSDLTGNRRYNTLLLESIDFSYIDFDPKQIWAEVLHNWTLDTQKTWQKIDEKVRDEINESQTIQPALFDTLDDIVIQEEGEWTKIADIYEKISQVDNKFDRNRQSKLVAEYFRVNNNKAQRRHAGRGYIGIKLR
jgi:predicted P-loop ATPase